jgi:hypothetical protein
MAGRTIEPYREASAPGKEYCFALTVKPIGWKARIWRAFDDSVTVMLRLDAPLDTDEIADEAARELLTPFRPSLRNLIMYLQRGSQAPLPLSWSVGRVSIDHEHSCVFLHRVLDDPFGIALATMFRAAETHADVTIQVALYEAKADGLILAVRDYDIGVGAEFLRSSQPYRF